MEHRLIQGGEVWLSFARSRVKALRATGLSYAGQRFTMPDGATVAVRVTPQADYIELTGGGFVSVYSNVQYPEDALETVKLPGNAAKLMTGTFPETAHDDVRDRPGFLGKTRFGTTPFAKHWIRRSQGTVDVALTGAGIEDMPLAPGAGGTYQRFGIGIGATQRYDFFADGLLVEQLVLTNTFLGKATSGGYYPPDVGGYSSSTYSWATKTSEAIPCLASGTVARFATLETDTTELFLSTNTGYGNDPGLLGFDHNVSISQIGTITQPGSSHVRVRKLEADGSYGAVNLGTQTYERSSTVNGNDTAIMTAVMGFIYYALRVDTILRIVNDVECTMAYRRWHALERVAAAPNGAVFALRETNLLEVSSRMWPLFGPADQIGAFSTSITRGYTLSFASPAGAVQDHIITGDLGPHGYIDGIIPSADGKKAYVYYGLHDPSEMLPAITHITFDSFLPLQFTEHLDVVEIKKEGDAYTLTKAKTIDLGPVKLRTYGAFLDDAGEPNGELTDEPALVAARTDHFNSRLHGASLAVGNFIWADRYCYDLKRGVFMALPDFEEYAKPTRYFEDSRQRDQITGPNDDRTSYLHVSQSGRRATYTLIKFGLVLDFSVGTDADTGEPTVIAGKTYTIPGGYSEGEFALGVVARFTN